MASDDQSELHDRTKTDRVGSRRREVEIWTLIHLSLWALLFCGLWLEWHLAMVIGFFAAIANISGFLLPAIVNVLCLLAVLPFANRSAGLANAGLFFFFALVLQVWQFKFWIDGAAAH